MPAAARIRRLPDRPAPVPALIDVAAPQPQRADLAELVRDQGDLVEQLGRGRVRRRLSLARAAELALDPAEARRAAELTVVWDEADGRLVRMSDLARAIPAKAWWEDAWEEARAEAGR